MAKRKSELGIQNDELTEGNLEPLEIQKDELKEEIANPAVNAVIYFEHTTWKGVREVYKCATCGTYRDERDSMIEHVLIHYPVSEHETIFNQLIKEK